jgi:hypothetical protein
MVKTKVLNIVAVNDGRYRTVPTKTDEHYVLIVTNNMQRNTIFFIVVKALHVSGVFPAHHQELKNCRCSIWYLCVAEQHTETSSISTTLAVAAT